MSSTYGIFDSRTCCCEIINHADEADITYSGFPSYLVQENKDGPHSVVSVTNRCSTSAFWPERHGPSFLDRDIKCENSALSKQSLARLKLCVDWS